MKLPDKRNGPPKPFATEAEVPMKIVKAWVIAGKTITCSHCDGIVFKKRKLMMNTRGLTLLGWDWMNENATALVCEHCSHIEWFEREPHEEPTPAEQVLRGCSK